MMSCPHVEQVRAVEARTQGCEECLKTGDTWVELRQCLSCGHVGCCDSSKNKHAAAHFRQTRHPIMRSFHSAGGEWAWCYEDQQYLRPVPQPRVAA